MNGWFLPVLGLVLTGCVSTSVIPVAKNKFMLSTTATATCGMSGAQKAALKSAAIETINRGYDKFMIVDGGGGSETEFHGYTPITSSTSFMGHGMYSTTSGGQPITSTKHKQELLVQMYEEGESGSDKALSARQELGPNWQKIVKEPNDTCDQGL